MNARHRRVWLAALILTGTGGRALAQANIQTLAPNPVMAGEAGFLNPAYLKDTRKFQINVAPFMAGNVHLSNNFVSAGTIIDYLGRSEGDTFGVGPVNAMARRAFRPAARLRQHHDQR